MKDKTCITCDYYNEYWCACNAWYRDMERDAQPCELYSDTGKKRNINDSDTRLTHPHTDCQYCELHNFADSTYQFATCNNPKLCDGLSRIDIRLLPEPWTVRCNRCKQYSPKQQLRLF